jgi:hypothetical protein
MPQQSYGRIFLSISLAKNIYAVIWIQEFIQGTYQIIRYKKLEKFIPTNPGFQEIYLCVAIMFLEHTLSLSGSDNVF